MLEGKAIVITGSGGGIGAACAKGTARLGASVIVNDVDAEAAEQTVREIRDEGYTAVACQADITDWDASGRLISSCIENFGRIDGLVNNAGLFHLNKMWDFDPAVARALVDVNVLGTMYCGVHAARAMIPQGSGSIVNVVSGAHVGMESTGIYGATKGAVASLVYAWAVELKEKGIRVNALSPLAANTRMARMNSEYRGDDPESKLQQPEANAPVVEYLLSDRAEDVTGQIVRIDSGELQLYTHPALLQPPILRDSWTCADVADAFDSQLKARMVDCGLMGMEHGPVPLTSGYTTRVEA